ncbi:MAG TPA: hypothetical protein ENI87_08940 [bacterium]|nr:hypothetical protein [bacterium]
MPSPLRLLRIARASAHSACGWLAYRLGWLGTARRRFERVLLLRGADFGAYVHLGRIAFDQGDYAGWRREFEHARRTDPVRFAQLDHPMELFEPRLAGTSCDPLGFGRLDDGYGYDATGSRATWRSLHPFGVQHHNQDRDRHHDGFGRADVPLAPGFDPLSSGQQLDEVLPPIDPPPTPTSEPTRPAASGSDPTIPDASCTGDDFSSAAERRRFQLRRPIDRREIARCDLNELARRLSS